MTWLILAGIGVLEAVVHLFRIRTASGTNPWASGVWTWAVCALRGLFVWIGVNAADASPAAFLIAYAGAAGTATATTQALCGVSSINPSSTSARPRL